jgi:hypothetical protein
MTNAGSARMTRSHALLHRPNATLAAARVEAWEGRNPGGIRVLLSNPRWESRLLRFLELSRVGMRVEGGEDEEGAHATRMDDWIVWEEEEGTGRDGTRPVTLSSLPRFYFVCIIC